MAYLKPGKNDRQPAGLASTWQQPKAKPAKPKKRVSRYTVRQGDDYTRLAEKLFGDARAAPDIANANPDVRELLPGQVITLPPKVRAAPAQVDQPGQVQRPGWASNDWQQRARQRNQTTPFDAWTNTLAAPFQTAGNALASAWNQGVGAVGNAFSNLFYTQTGLPRPQQPQRPAYTASIPNSSLMSTVNAFRPQPAANQVTGRSVVPGYTARPIPGATNYQMPRPVQGGPTYTTTPTYIPAATPGEALPLQVQQSRSPTQLPDTWMNGLQRTATHTAAMLADGRYPVTISGSDQYYLGLADDELIAAGYIKMPWGGWAIAYPKRPATDPGTGSGYGKRAAAPRGGGGGGGNRGGGGGGYGYGNYAPSQYSGTGRTYSDLTMGLVTWRI